MPQRIDSESEPTTPQRPRNQGPLANILNVFQEFTPSKTQRQMRGLREELQGLLNDAEDAFSAKDSEIADLSNQVVPARPRRRRKRFHRADDAPASLDSQNSETLEDRTRKAGRHFIIDEGLFFIDEGAIWSLDVDDDFDYSTEFDSKSTRIQAQLQDVIRLLPDDAVSRRTEEWIGDAVHGMGGQRSATAYRLRRPSLKHLADATDLKHFTTSSDRFENFKQRIGYVPATDTAGAYYSAFKAPILYDEFAGEIDVDHLFRNPLLLNIHACILRGADGPTDLFKDNPYRPQAPYMEKIHNITRTSTGAIANAAVLAIWLYSADTKFLERGNETNINYRKRYRQYVEELRKGLTAKKAWVDALLNYWDGVFFPDADDDDGAARGAGDGENAEMESVVDAFANAPSLETPPAVFSYVICVISYLQMAGL
ncbi:hypothetical protein R3P38DRAFT_2554068 [Favolaschia claudopus]|uniref:Uncharacterized protein n=1 Tax=Favolaschia claudopus TaxID=2862362 RepID=A0AAW0AD63_9AGAR